MSKKPGYHLRDIPKGVLGESSKIREELEEFEDAMEQNNPVMALVELSDLLGAVEAILKEQFIDFTLDDLITMHRATERAFKNGHRHSAKAPIDLSDSLCDRCERSLDGNGVLFNTQTLCQTCFDHTIQPKFDEFCPHTWHLSYEPGVEACPACRRLYR